MEGGETLEANSAVIEMHILSFARSYAEAVLKRARRRSQQWREVKELRRADEDGFKKEEKGKLGR